MLKFSVLKTKDDITILCFLNFNIFYFRNITFYFFNNFIK